jgi:glycosyltransferase involved in cell wall biosynthesis
MNDPIHLSIVIPAFNEEARLGSSLDELRRYLSESPWTWELRVVDDGSSDRTAAVAADAAVGDPRIVVQREPHRGKGGAVKAGMLAATAAYRFLCDADLSMPVAELPRFLPPQVNADIAIGSREGIGARRVGEPVARHLAGRVFNHLVRRLAVPDIEDTQCGFKMFTARAAETVFPRLSVNGWAFDIEVLHIARERGFSIAQIPIEWHYRRESRLDLVRDGASMFRDVLAIRARARRREYR